VDINVHGRSGRLLQRTRSQLISREDVAQRGLHDRHP
jgi:hypothetical protein